MWYYRKGIGKFKKDLERLRNADKERNERIMVEKE